MADQLPTADSLFDTVPDQLPKADDIFGTDTPPPYKPKYIGPSATWGINRSPSGEKEAQTAMDLYKSQTSLGRVLNAFGQGAANGWGKEPLGLSPEAQVSIANAGIDKKSLLAVPEQIAGAFNSGVTQAAAAGADAIFQRLPSAALGGALSGFGQAADEWLPGWMKKAYEGITGMKYNTGNNVLTNQEIQAANQTLAATFPFIPEAAALSTMDEATFAGLKKPTPDQLLPRMQAFDQIISENVKAIDDMKKQVATRKVEAPAGTPTVATSETGSITPLPTNIAIKKDKSGFYVERTNPDGTTTNYRGQGDLKTEQDFAEYVQKSPKFKDDWKNNPPVPQKAVEPTQEISPANSPEPQAPSVEPTLSQPTKYEMPSDNGKEIDINALGEPGSLEAQVLGAHPDLALYNQYGSKMHMSDIESLSETYGVDPADIMKRDNPYSNLDPIQAAKIAKAGAQMGEEVQALPAVTDEASAWQYITKAQKVINTGDDIAGISRMSGRSTRALAATKEERMKLQAVATFLKENLEGAVAVTEDGHLTPEAIKAIQDIQKEMRMINDPTSVNKALRKKAGDLETGLYQKLRNIVLEVGYNFMLTSPTTHMANIFGNTLTAFYRVAETGIASAIGAPRALFTGSKDRVFAGEAGVKLLGLLQGLPDGFRAAKKAMIIEEPTFGKAQKLENNNKAIAMNAEGRSPLMGTVADVVNTVGKGVRLSGNLMMAEDEVFKAMAYRASLEAQALRSAKQKGLTGDAAIAHRTKLLDPSFTPDKMRLQAIDEANYDTFTKDLGTIGKHLEAVGRAAPELKFIFFPFVKYPTNSFKFLMERTPLYPVAGIWNKEVQAVLSGKRGQAVRDEQLAKMVLGTAILIPLVKWAMNGNLTGNGPTDPEQHAGWMELNKPTSIKIGGEWYDYSRIVGPLAPLFSTVADVTANMHGQKITDIDASRVGTMLLIASGNIARNLPMADAITNMATFIDNRDTYAMDKFMNQLGTRFIPAVANDIQRINDPYLRDVQTFSDAVNAKTPGQEEKVPYRLDEFGQPILKDQPGLGPIAGFANPVSVRPAVTDPIKKAMYDVGYYMAKPSDTINGIKMSREQYYMYQVQVGTTTKLAFSQMVSSPGWNNLPTGTRKEMFRKVAERIRNMGRAPIMMDNNMEIINKSIEKKLELWK